MDKRIKKLWVEALRSKKFRKGKGYLCQVGKTGERRYCCWGVLSELAVKAGVVPAPVLEKNCNGEGLDALIYDDDSVYYPSQKVLDWAGISAYTMDVGGAELADHNDGKPVQGVRPKGFGKIADLIDEHL